MELVWSRDFSLYKTPYSLLGCCTPSILVRNGFGQIYLILIQRHRHKIVSPLPVSCESTTWRKGTAQILNNPAWRRARPWARLSAVKASKGCSASRRAKMDQHTGFSQKWSQSSCCCFSPRSTFRGMPQRQGLRFPRTASLMLGRTGAYPFAKSSIKGNIL